ncbi:MAG: hypothetical protein ACREEM_01110 [Blastocatellia bacterium]
MNLERLKEKAKERAKRKGRKGMATEGERAYPQGLKKPAKAKKGFWLRQAKNFLQTRSNRTSQERPE